MHIGRYWSFSRRVQMFGFKGLVGSYNPNLDIDRAMV